MWGFGVGVETQKTEDKHNEIEGPEKDHDEIEGPEKDHRWRTTEGAAAAGRRGLSVCGDRRLR